MAGKSKAPIEKGENNLQDQKKVLGSGSKMSELEREIILEAKKIAKNEVSSCYTLVEKTRELIHLQKA